MNIIVKVYGYKYFNETKLKAESYIHLPYKYG